MLESLSKRSLESFSLPSNRIRSYKDPLAHGLAAEIREDLWSVVGPLT